MDVWIEMYLLELSSLWSLVGDLACWKLFPVCHSNKYSGDDPLFVRLETGALINHWGQWASPLLLACNPVSPSQHFWCLNSPLHSKASALPMSSSLLVWNGHYPWEVVLWALPFTLLHPPHWRWRFLQSPTVIPSLPCLMSFRDSPCSLAPFSRLNFQAKPIRPLSGT